MLSQPEDIEPDLIGKLDLLKKIFKPPCALDTLVKSGCVHIAECVKPEFHGRSCHLDKAGMFLHLR
ncbi:hypothetical protein D3C71_566850 [compost metagenome]